MGKLKHHVLAAFYSDARLNILSCLNDIRQKSGQNAIRDDAEILTAYTTLSLTSAHTTVERQSKLIEQLRRYFHFLDVVTSAKPVNDEKLATPDDYDRTLKRLLQFVLTEVSDVFYHQHAGLFLPGNIRDQLFEYKGSLIGFYLKYEQDASTTDDSLIRIKNQHLIDKLKKAGEQMNSSLKMELAGYYEQLLQYEKT